MAHGQGRDPFGKTCVRHADVDVDGHAPAWEETASNNPGFSWMRRHRYSSDLVSCSFRQAMARPVRLQDLLRAFPSLKARTLKAH